MKKKSLIIIASLSSVFISSIALAQSWNSTGRSDSFENLQVQRSIINLLKEDLRDPHYLIINTSGGSLRGEIKLNNKVLRTLNSRNIKIDLAPLLKRGKNIVEIYGKDGSRNYFVTLEFRSPYTRVTQRTSGNSNINQILVIDVE